MPGANPNWTADETPRTGDTVVPHREHQVRGTTNRSTGPGNRKAEDGQGRRVAAPRRADVRASGGEVVDGGCELQGFASARSGGATRARRGGGGYGRPGTTNASTVGSGMARTAGARESQKRRPELCQPVGNATRVYATGPGGDRRRLLGVAQPLWHAGGWSTNKRSFNGCVHNGHTCRRSSPLWSGLTSDALSARLGTPCYLPILIPSMLMISSRRFRWPGSMSPLWSMRTSATALFSSSGGSRATNRAVRKAPPPSLPTILAVLAVSLIFLDE